MKKPKSFLMAYILSGLILSACEGGSDDVYESPQNIQVIKEFSNSKGEVLKFNVKAKDWRSVSGTDRFVKISVPAITDSVMKHGLVIIYLNEAGKNISLPFTYYQVRRAMSFQPSYEKGYAYVNVLGNFILNTSTSYTFRIFVLNPTTLKQFKQINWYNFDQAMLVMNSKGERN